MCKVIPSRKEKNQGMNWISQHKRLAIYLRDELACCYCGSSIVDGVQLTLDHLKPYTKGGSNEASNLITCCLKCNSSRGKRSYTMFAISTAAYIDNGVAATDIIKHIQKVIKRKLNLIEAKALIANQGSCFKVLKTYNHENSI